MVRILMAWGVAVLTTLVVAYFTKAGPTLMTLAPGNGIHLSDVIFAVLAGTAAVLYTRNELRRN